MALNFWRTAAHAILMMLAGWIPREQEAAVAYQQEEIRALREVLGGKRPHFTDAQRRRLALKARPLSHARLRELVSLVTPDTLTAPCAKGQPARNVRETEILQEPRGNGASSRSQGQHPRIAALLPPTCTCLNFGEPGSE